jgi:F-type H+-transporting ATPase subunit alpha
MLPERLRADINRAFTGMQQARAAFAPQCTPREIGIVASVSTGIATVTGLSGVGFEELVRFADDLYGIAFNVDAEEIGVVLLGDYSQLHSGDEVTRTGRVMDVAVGEALLGRVVDPLGRALDGKGPLGNLQRLPIERDAKAIMDRAPVSVPLQTGIKVIDALTPIGRGQRQLILGDRQTGKTAIAIDAILNQRGQNVVCIYNAIAQRASAVAKVIAELTDRGAMEYSLVVVSEGNDAPGLTYIAPYAATSIAEHFMEAGRDVLIILRRPHAARPRLPGTLAAAAPATGSRGLSRAISSTSTRVCWNAPRTCASNSVAAPSPPCPSSRPRLRTLPPTSPPI